MHHFEEIILKFILTNGEVTWGQLKKNLVNHKSSMAQGTLSKYKRSLEKEDWIKQKLNTEGQKIYYIPENKQSALKNILNAHTPQEQIDLYKSWWLRTLKVIAEAPDVETLKKKQKAAKNLLKIFGK